MAVAPILLAASSRGTNPATLLSTELNALANNALATLSAAISNLAELDLYADLELAFTFAVAPTANTTLDVYFVRSVDGTNYEDNGVTSSVVRPQNGYVGSVPVQAIATAQRIVIPQVLLPPRDFKVVVFNNATGQALSASGHTLKAYCYHLGVG